jgi:hypothetical protein
MKLLSGLSGSSGVLSGDCNKCCRFHNNSI